MTLPNEHSVHPKMALHLSSSRWVPTNKQFGAKWELSGHGRPSSRYPKDDTLEKSHCYHRLLGRSLNRVCSCFFFFSSAGNTGMKKRGGDETAERDSPSFPPSLPSSQPSKKPPTPPHPSQQQPLLQASCPAHHSNQFFLLSFFAWNKRPRVISWRHRHKKVDRVRQRKTMKRPFFILQIRAKIYPFPPLEKKMWHHYSWWNEAFLYMLHPLSCLKNKYIIQMFCLWGLSIWGVY